MFDTEYDEEMQDKVLELINADPENILLVKDRYLNETIWAYCIDIKPSLFKKMKRPTYEMCRRACRADGRNLKHIRSKFKYIIVDKALVDDAVKSNPVAILYAPQIYLSKEDIEGAFERSPQLMESFDQIDPEFLFKIVREKPYSFQYVEDKMTDEMICEILRTTPIVCAYVHNMTPIMLKVLEHYHPSYYELYSNNLKQISEARQNNMTNEECTVPCLR